MRERKTQPEGTRGAEHRAEDEFGSLLTLGREPRIGNTLQVPIRATGTAVSANRPAMHPRRVSGANQVRGLVSYQQGLGCVPFSSILAYIFCAVTTDCQCFFLSA